MMNHDLLHLSNNLNSVGIELKEEDNSAASSALSPTSSPIHGSRQLKTLQQEQQDMSSPDYVITFRQTFPLHVYDSCLCSCVVCAARLTFFRVSVTVDSRRRLRRFHSTKIQDNDFTGHSRLLTHLLPCALVQNRNKNTNIPDILNTSSSAAGAIRTMPPCHAEENEMNRGTV